MGTKGISADLVIKNGTIITVDENDTTAQAVAVFDGKIVRVGTNDDVDPLIGENTRVLDLTGKTVIPGLNDSHTHNVATGDFLHSLGMIDAAAELNPSISDLLDCDWIVSGSG